MFSEFRSSLGNTCALIVLTENGKRPRSSAKFHMPMNINRASMEHSMTRSLVQNSGLMVRMRAKSDHPQRQHVAFKRPLAICSLIGVLGAHADNCPQRLHIP